MGVHRVKVGAVGPKVDYATAHGASFRFQMTGMDRTKRHLRQLDKDLQYNVAKAINVGVNKVYAKAKVLAPEDTGRLKGRITKIEASAPVSNEKVGIAGFVYLAADSIREAIKHYIIEFGGKQINYPAIPLILYIMQVEGKTHKGRVQRAVGKAVREMYARGGRNT